MICIFSKIKRRPLIDGTYQAQLKEFALFLFDEMREFYRSDEDKEYYKEWIKNHPEFAENEKSALKIAHLIRWAIFN